MKKKIYFIIYSIVQMIANVVIFVQLDKYANAFVAELNEAVAVYPEEMAKTMSEMFTLDFAQSYMIFTSGVAILVTIAFLVLALSDRVYKKKGLAIGLMVATIFTAFSNLSLILAIATLIVILSGKSEKKVEEEKLKEKPTIKRLRDLKVTNRELVLGIILLVVYCSQFVMPYVPMSDLAYLIGVSSFYVIVFILAITTFAKRLKRDFGAFKDNLGTYVKYIFKMWGVMFLLSMVAVIIKSFLGVDDISANQTALNNSDLWFTIPLAMIWAPIVEESIFRGMIRRFIPNNDKLFIVVSAVLFGLLHTVGQEVGLFNTLVQSLQYIAMGLVMAYSYAKTNNICTNMGVHFCQNTLASVLMILMSLA